MKFSVLQLFIVFVLFFSSCKKDNVNPTPAPKSNIDTSLLITIDSSQLPKIDFAYSIFFEDFRIKVCTSNASSNIADSSTYFWSFNGSSANEKSSDENPNCVVFPKEGYFSISLTVTTPMGLKYSNLHSFQIYNNKVISKDFPNDTTSYNGIAPSVDFGISILSTPNNATVSYSDASSGIPINSDVQWFIDGIAKYNQSNSIIYYNEGSHTIVLKITTPAGVSYSKLREFEVKFK